MHHGFIWRNTWKDGLISPSAAVLSSIFLILILPLSFAFTINQCCSVVEERFE
jgi:hypothetical protein